MEKKNAICTANMLLKKGTQDVKKLKMFNSLESMNVGVFIELERIKKPSNLALQTTRMFCMLVNAFRDKPFSAEEIEGWPKIQQFLTNHVTRFMSDILANIKNKVLGEMGVNRELRDTIRERVLKIRHEFFKGEGLKQFKHLDTNKSLKAIIYFVFNIVAFVLDDDDSKLIMESKHSTDLKKNKISGKNVTDIEDKKNADENCNREPLDALLTTTKQFNNK